MRLGRFYSANVFLLRVVDVVIYEEEDESLFVGLLEVEAPPMLAADPVSVFPDRLGAVMDFDKYPFQVRWTDTALELLDTRDASIVRTWRHGVDEIQEAEAARDKANDEHNANKED